jgi:DNA-binding CsgD family transcriptional regulator
MTHRYPEPLVVDLANLLRHHHATELFPLVLGLIGDQVQPEPRTTSDPAMVGTDTIRHLIRLFDRAAHLPLLPDLLGLLEPWLPVLVKEEPLGPVNLDAAAAAAITADELKVLAGMANGLTNNQIARSLFVSPDAVKTRARNLFKRLDAKDRAHAVRLGIQKGLLPLPRHDDGRGVA